MAEKKRVFVVDDEESIRELFKNILESEGYQVDTASSAEEALEFLQDSNVQVMFFDLNLPGMNGIELCREVRKMKPISIINAFTGYGSVFELLNCREAGFDDYFKKPVKIDDVLATVKDAFVKVDRWTRR